MCYRTRLIMSVVQRKMPVCNPVRVRVSVQTSTSGRGDGEGSGLGDEGSEDTKDWGPTLATRSSLETRGIEESLRRRRLSGRGRGDREERDLFFSNPVHPPNPRVGDVPSRT